MITLMAPGRRSLSRPVSSRPPADTQAGVAPQTSSPIWALIAALAVLAAGLVAAGALTERPTPEALRIPVWAMAVLFALTETVVLHVQVRREARSVSLSEIPLCLALFFMSPPLAVVAHLVGNAPVWLFWRKQPMIKVVFNLVNAAAEIGLALLVFRLLAGDATAADPQSWVAAVVAAGAAAALGALSVTTVIAAAERVRPSRQIVVSMLTAMPIAAFTSLLGVISVAALSWNRWTAVPLLGLGIGIILVYRAYSTLSGRHLSVERLYRFSEVVGSSAEVDEVLRTVLEQAQELLRAEHAEIVFATPGSHDGFAVRLGSDGALARTRLDDSMALDPVWTQVIADGAPVLITRHPRDPRQRAHLVKRGLQEAIVCPLRGAAGVVGAVTVANRMGNVRTFDRQDVQLLETLSNNAGVAWQNSRLIDRLRHDALHDALTGLPNRVLLHQETVEALDSLAAPAGPAAAGRGVAMVLADLDGFKEVNDTLGHQYGDLLLQEVSQRFVDAAGERGLVARLGGDEFAVLVRDTTLDGTLELVGDMLRSLEQPVVLDELSLEIAASFGIATAPEHATKPSGLLKRADVAMYAAKTSARGLQVYGSELDTHSPERLRLARELRQAISHHDVEIYLQPQARLATGEVIGVEALARWQHPENGWVSPEEFVAVAERSGLIRNLTIDVLQQAVGFAAAFRKTGRDMGVSVNLSARNLHDVDLPDEVARVLREHDVPAGLLTFEITESTVMTDSDRSMELLQRLADMGVLLSIDDFGTGYSSLSHLRRLPVSEVKIDRTFVTNMSRDTNDATIAHAIIDLAANLDLRVVAEGVEETATWQHLADVGCERAQGYFLSAAMPMHEFAPWLASYEASLAH